MSPNPNSSTNIHTTQIDTGGGVSVTGNVDLANGDFVGRDQTIHGDLVHGNKVVIIQHTDTTRSLWRMLWWVIAALATMTFTLWLYIWWHQQHADLSSVESWLILIAAIAPFITGLFSWLNTHRISPDEPSILVTVVSHLLDSIVQGWRSLFYQKPYLAKLTERIRYYDTTDLSIQGPAALDAEQVYVEPHLKISPSHAISTSVLTPDERQLDEQCHPIWHYLRHTQSNRAATPRPLVLLAGPGYGKSALLRHMVQIVSSGRRARKRYLALKKLPLLLFLRAHIRQIVTTPPTNTLDPTTDYRRDYTLPQAIADSILLHAGPPPPHRWFTRQLDKGHCVVLLDGLDEIADPTEQSQVAAWINHQRHNFQHNQFVLTSRPLAYQDNRLEGATIIEIMPFATNQIQDFVHRWYRADALAIATETTPLIEHTAHQQAQQLIQRIAQSPALTRLAQNPLLLTMILHVHKHKGDALPEKRITLLTEACRVLLTRRPDPPNISIVSAEQKQAALLPLAYALQQKRMTEIELEAATIIVNATLQGTPLSEQAEDFLERVRRDSGLLLIENRKLLFAHLIFQSYLSACHVSKANLLDDLLTNLDDSWWRETILLYCALNDATAVVQACLSLSIISSVRFRLALECLNEADRISPATLNEIARIIRTGLQDITARRIMQKALAEIRKERELRLNETKYVDTSLITHAEYQIFLFDHYDQNRFHQPDHWLDLQFAADNAVLPIVGIRAQDALAFCAWLNEQELTNAWRFRLPHRIEIEEEGILAALKLPSVNFWMLDQQKPICLRPTQIPSLSLDFIKRQLVDDIQHPHSYVPVTLFGVNTNPLSHSEAVALLTPYDFDRSQLTSHITQIRHSLALAIQNANSLANSLRLASQELRRKAEEYRQEINKLEHSLTDLQINIQTIEARRDAKIQAITEHYQQEYAKIEDHIAQQHVAEKTLKHWQESAHSSIIQAYESPYAEISNELQRITAMIENNNTITAKNHDIIRKNYQQNYEQLDEALRSAQAIYSKNQAIHENNLRIIQNAINHIDTLINQYQRKIKQFEDMDKTQYDVTAAVASCEFEISRLQGERERICSEKQAEIDGTNDISQQNRKVITDNQQQRKQLEDEEQQKHAEQDSSNQRNNAQNEKIISDYQQQLQKRKEEEKKQHDEIDSRVDEAKKQIHETIRRDESEREHLRTAERQQVNESKRNYEPSLQDAESTVNGLTRDRNELAKAETTARQHATRCEEFPSSIARPLNTALSLLDDFDHASHAFFSNVSPVAVATEKALGQALEEASELIAFLQEISASAATPVTLYQQDLETIRQTLLSAKGIINRRDTIAAILESVCARVENSDLQPLADINQLDRIDRRLRTTLIDIQGYLSHSNRQLNLQSDLESALHRLAYMRLILLTGVLCLLDTPKLDHIGTILTERLFEQYIKLIIIEDRMRGVVPAYEGLRLIKEYIIK